MNGGRTPTVLVVDDDPQVRALYADYLADDYAVTTASDGRDALIQLNQEIDVVLLDRRMPGLSGAEVLDRIRARTSDCAVAIVTGVEPDLDVIDMGFDDYVSKPITREKLRSLVRRLLSWLDYESSIREYYALATKVGLLEANRRRTPEYRELRRQLEAAAAHAQTALDSTLAVDDVEAVFHRTVSAD